MNNPVFSQKSLQFFMSFMETIQSWCLYNFAVTYVQF